MLPSNTASRGYSHDPATGEATQSTPTTQLRWVRVEGVQPGVVPRLEQAYEVTRWHGDALVSHGIEWRPVPIVILPREDATHG